MAEFLSKHTKMGVLEATNNMEVEPDSIYVIPSKKLMTIRDGRLSSNRIFGKPARIFGILDT